MTDIKWIKLSVNMFDDEKIKLIRTMPEGDSITLIWVQMLCLAGRINDGGAVYLGQNLAYSDEMLATIFDHPLSTMRIALTTLEQFGLIEFDEKEKFKIANWEKHQSTDKMARIRHQNRERQQRHYYRSKLRELDVDVDAKGFPDSLNELKKLYEQVEEKPNVRLTLPNATEVRSKKKEVRGKKEEVRREKEEVTTTTVKKEENDSGGEKLPPKNVFGTWEKLWMFPNLVQKELLVELSEKYGDKLVVAAIKVAGANDVIKGRAINFIEAVLKEWEDNNIETIEQAREYTKNRNKVKGNRNYNKQNRKKETLPDWATKETTQTQADEVVNSNLGSRLEELRKMRDEE